ncbi:hypothetical protein H4582DRAFT_341689 [Lactarius indigo]|nr:hypothetical protein H4582DRAFT_341689 [Lactarius indigo]
MCHRLRGQKKNATRSNREVPSIMSNLWPCKTKRLFLFIFFITVNVPSQVRTPECFELGRNFPLTVVRVATPRGDSLAMSTGNIGITPFVDGHSITPLPLCIWVFCECDQQHMAIRHAVRRRRLQVQTSPYNPWSMCRRGGLWPDTVDTKHVPQVTLRGGRDWRPARHHYGELDIIPAGILTKRISPTDDARLLLPTLRVRERGSRAINRVCGMRREREP